MISRAIADNGLPLKYIPNGPRTIIGNGDIRTQMIWIVWP